MYDNSNFTDHNSHTFCFSCVFFDALSLAVFYYADAFNQDVSKWNTGAVRTMESSKCNLSPSVRLPLCFLIQQLEFHLITIHTRSVIFVVVVLWWVVVSFFDAPTLAVFESHCEFNQDVSKWSHAFPYAVFLR